MEPLKPFLKWAGGKRWLFDSGQYSFPGFNGRYLEPFLGGGAGFFRIQRPNSILSDSNKRLVELYMVIRDEVQEFEAILRRHAQLHSREYYYELRDRRLRKPATRAAQFLYLNRTCWNGLYRENLSGKFNVPIGTKDTVTFEGDDFGAWSRSLASVHLECCDFEKTVDKASAGDFLFVDPPYSIRHNLNGFVKYNQNIFAWDDQIRLRDALWRAADRGASFAMTNADHETVRDLYSGLGIQRQVVRHSVIAGQSLYRLRATELLVVG